MNRAEKSDLSSALKQKFSKAEVAIFADYKGLTSAQADELRRRLRTHNVEVKVLKNNIARLAVGDGFLGNDAKQVLDETVGPTLVAFAYGDASAAAKEIYKFSEENEALKIKDSLMGSKRIDAAAIEQLGKLPPREVLLANLLGTMCAPVTNFVRVLAAVPRGLVTVLAAIEKKKAG
ncbi:MAG: 50S ribosomal protein L10 [Bdellovibrionota bacterium]